MSLDKDTLIALVHSFIHSRLDYCNSLLFGVLQRDIALLQSVQNRAVKLVVGGLKFDHDTPILNDLH